MEYRVNLKVYEGPMDLLLDLIKKNEVDIYDIPIQIITEQFLDYIEEANRINLELTSDFILMASTLIEIKSKMLLPRIPEIIEEDEQEDPRDELVKKILEYEKYKEVSEILKESAQYEAKAFYKLPEDFSKIDDIILVKNLNVENLVKSFNKILKNAEKNEEISSIRRDYFPVEKAMKIIKEKIKISESFLFTEILSENYTVSEVVSFFLSLLELIKTGEIKAKQRNDCGEIEIRR